MSKINTVFYPVKKAGVVNGEITNVNLFSNIVRYTILLFYPLDFTFVCPTELHAFDGIHQQLKELGCDLYAVSVDSEFSHLKWINTPKSEGGIKGIKLPLISDLDKSLSKSLDVLAPESVSYRGMFIFDKTNALRISHINDLPIGRSVDEVLRLVLALQHNEVHGEACPANWNKGKKGIVTSQEGLLDYFKE